MPFPRAHARPANAREIALGDALVLRTEKKHAYLSWDPPSPGGEQEYKILSVTDAGSTAESKTK